MLLNIRGYRQYDGRVDMTFFISPLLHVTALDANLLKLYEFTIMSIARRSVKWIF
jgi:hypothetical protein